MRYQGSEAVSLDAVERRRPQQVPSRSFDVVEGEGLDARAREGVGPQFLARAKAISAAVCLVVALGMCRVALSAATVSTLQASSQITSDIKAAQTLEDDLKVERSVLSSSSRITRIATQNYGMVYAGVGEAMTLSTDSSDADGATEATDANGTAPEASDSADQSTDSTSSATTTDSSATPADTSTAASDGDVAQTAGEGAVTSLEA